MAMQIILRQRPEITAVIKKIVSEVISEDSRRDAAMNFIDRFTEMPRTELPLDLPDFVIILKQITVLPGRTMAVELLDGTKVRLTVPVYGPQRGWLNKKQFQSTSGAGETNKAGRLFVE